MRLVLWDWTHFISLFSQEKRYQWHRHQKKKLAVRKKGMIYHKRWIWGNSFVRTNGRKDGVGLTSRHPNCSNGSEQNDWLRPSRWLSSFDHDSRLGREFCQETSHCSWVVLSIFRAIRKDKQNLLPISETPILWGFSTVIIWTWQ